MLRPVARPGILAGATVALALCLCPALTDAQTSTPLDHFWCYGIQDTSPDAPVLLRDRFDAAGAAGQEFLVRNPLRFCNPVEKTNSAGVTTPITDPDGHLKLYLIPPTDLGALPVRIVHVRNQFGFQRLLTFDPLLLAVPTGKNPQLPSDRLDHFKCYRAYGDPRNAAVRLRDQFQGPTAATVLRPALFCNPAEKTHLGVVTPIKNRTNHLVCYYTTKTPLTDSISFSTRNQIVAEEQLSAQVADILCVPSQKVRVMPLP